MRHVLAFGDSLTWGSCPDGPARHSFVDRWPNVLAEGLPATQVISEGLRGRTTCFDQASYPGQVNGAALLPTLIDSHAPLDLGIVMLGSNDIYFGFSAERAVQGLARLVEIIRHHPLRMDGIAVPDVLLVAPPEMVVSNLGDVSETMIAQSCAYPTLVEAQAELQRCKFFDAGRVAAASPLDGIHLDASNTRAIGDALIAPVSEILQTRAKEGRIIF